MEGNKQQRQYWYAVHILYNKVESCVELLDSINAKPGDTLRIVFDLPEGWQDRDWSLVECYPRPDRVSYRHQGRRTVKFVPLLSSLLFIHTTPSQIKLLARFFGNKMRLYTHLGTQVLRSSSSSEVTWEKEVIQPVKIPAHEMARLKLYLSMGADVVEPIPPEKASWGKGTRVRVIEGEYKGWEGEIRRIKCKTRLVVSVHDVRHRTVAAFSLTTYIPFRFLEEIPEE